MTPPPALLDADVPGTAVRLTRPLIGRIWVTVVTFVVVIAVWWAIVLIGNYPSFILPTPLAVAERIWSMLLDGSLLLHFSTTVLEAGLGFLLALVIGSVLGYFLGHSRRVERAISPYVALSQGLPVVALAPLLVLWVSDDLLRKVIVVALIVFFPVLVNTILAVRSIDRSMREEAIISGANRLQILYHVELPLGMRPFLGGVKLGLTLSITGAVVGEFVSSGAGLGFLLILGRGLFDTTLIFVGLTMLALLAMLAFGLVGLLERWLVTWE